MRRYTPTGITEFTICIHGHESSIENAFPGFQQSYDGYTSTDSRVHNSGGHVRR